MRSLTRPLTHLIALGAAGLMVTACAGTPSPGPTTTSQPPTQTSPTAPTSAPASDAVPALTVTEVVGGLDIPWGLDFLPDGSLIFTQRPGRVSVLPPGATEALPVTIEANVAARGEGGMLDLALSPEFTRDSTMYLCFNTTEDVRVFAYELSDDFARATHARDVITGITTSSGRHSGCRLLFGPDGFLYVGTGDAARGEAPQSLTELGGKVLRVDASTGEPAPGNPFIAEPDPHTKLIYTYGHRNIQGLALQPDTDLIYSVEHGPGVDDEVNRIQPGANYGWNPVGGTYNESVPMTDTSLQNAKEAVWSSGPTIATSGATFVTGDEWGAYDGTLFVAALKGSQLLSMRVDEDAPAEAVQVPELTSTYGRLRTVEQGPDGAVYVMTSNGGDDVILKVTS